jgi:hypothetical protein
MNESPRSRSAESLSREDVQALILQMEKMEVQIQALARRVVAAERRQGRFTTFVRFMLELYDRNTARLHLLDGRSGKETVDEILRVKPARSLQHTQQRRRGPAPPAGIELESVEAR